MANHLTNSTREASPPRTCSPAVPRFDLDGALIALLFAGQLTAAVLGVAGVIASHDDRPPTVIAAHVHAGH